jgi:Tol biopolymer transport system component
LPGLTERNRVTLPAGERLGSYQVIALLGVGGMGEVYRASDSKLGRVVALKVLPSGLHMDEQRMLRFEREAQILAALNHPNIATIHGLEDSGPTRALVMELVEGPTLADRIAEGPLPLEEALGIAAQIAEALEYAHERGIIHRDLKPANVKITPDGKVKVLDFGLAKALDDAPETVNIATSPTLSVAATRAGIILGTAAYMSPEQAKGKSVDRRGDVWAFGVIIYEMLTGKQLFSGETASETLAAVIMKEPDLNSLPAATPAPIRQLVRRCLTRDPRQRLRDIGEARIAINEYLANPAGAALETGSSATANVAPQPAWRRALPWALAALAAAIAALALWGPWRATSEPAQPIRLSVEIGAHASLAAAGFGPAAIISPDGSKFAFVAVSESDQRNRLYIRQRNQLEATPLTGTENARDPFFSPDGEWIAFFADAKLKKISAQGGAAVTLCDAPGDRGGAWSEDGTIIFARGNREGLSRVPEAGGTPEPLTTLDASKGEITHRWPQVLPGGKAILFAAHNSGSNFGEGAIIVQVLKTGERKTVRTGGMFARYVPSGHLVYANDGTLFAMPFDLARLQTTGPASPFLEHVAMSGGTGSAQYDFSKTGAFVYVVGNNQGGIIVVDWMDREGKFQPLRTVPEDYLDPRFSPDGKKLALVVQDRKSSDIWVYDLDRDTLSRVTFGPGYNETPVWTPDGRRIVYSSTQGNSPDNLFWVKSDGTGAPERLTESKGQQSSYSISLDGKFLAFDQVDSKSSTGRDIWTLSLEGSDKPGWKPGQPQVFLNSPFRETEPAFSPDGRWLAYSSDDTGTTEVYVRPFPGPGGKWQISNGGGVCPIWSKNGKELFSRTLQPPYKMMVANYRLVGNAFQNDKPQVWSPGTFESRGPSTWTADLAPDGRRFAVLRIPETSANSPTKNDKFVLILDAFEELRRKINPAKP